MINFLFIIFVIMTTIELLNSDKNKRKEFYMTASEDALKDIHNEILFYEDHDNLKEVKMEIDLFVNFMFKPIKID